MSGMDEAAAKPAFGRAELVEIRELSPTVRNLVFRSRTPLSWTPGQHVQLLVETGGERIKQPYSIASAPDPSDARRFELAVSAEETSAATTAVRAFEVGAEVEFKGPKGELKRPAKSPEPALMVATGSGLAPMRAMVQAELSARTDGPQLALLFGCREEHDLLWAEELRELARDHPRFRYEPTLSKPSDAWPGRRGYVQEHVADVAPPLGDAPVYLCGRSAMIDAVREVLAALGVAPERIHTERHG